MRRRTSTCASLAALLAVAAMAPTAAGKLPAGVVLLGGTTSQDLEAQFSYAVKGRTINGFRLVYTCRGKQPKAPSDFYSIFDGGSDAKALAQVKDGGAVSFDLRGSINRFSDDGSLTKRRGRLVVKATVTGVAAKRVMKGTARVVNTKCPSAALTFRATGRR